MSILSHIGKRLALVAALAAVSLTGGCGGVELEGPAFEALGLTGGKKTTDKKVPDRAPIVVPPDLRRLPEPQQAKTTVPPQNWPTDPDAIRKAEASEAAKKQKEINESGDWSKNSDGVDEFERKMDPMGNRTGILGNKLGKLFGGGDNEDPGQ